MLSHGRLDTVRHGRANRFVLLDNACNYSPLAVYLAEMRRCRTAIQQLPFQSGRIKLIRISKLFEAYEPVNGVLERYAPAGDAAVEPVF